MLKDIQAEQLTGVVYSAKDEGDCIFFWLYLMKYHFPHLKKRQIMISTNSILEQINLVVLDFSKQVSLISFRFYHVDLLQETFLLVTFVCYNFSIYQKWVDIFYWANRREKRIAWPLWPPLPLNYLKLISSNLIFGV